MTNQIFYHKQKYSVTWTYSGQTYPSIILKGILITEKSKKVGISRKKLNIHTLKHKRNMLGRVSARPHWFSNWSAPLFSL